VTTDHCPNITVMKFHAENHIFGDVAIHGYRKVQVISRKEMTGINHSIATSLLLHVICI